MSTDVRSQKFVFPNAQGEQLAARLELPAGEPRAHALFAHCFTCSKDIAAATRIARALCRRGFAVLRFDFTGLGNSEGDFANTHFSSNVRDLLAAADHLREHRAAPSLLVGHSLGGAAVLSAAAEIPEVRAVVTLGAPSEPSHVKRLLADSVDAIREQGRARVRLAGREFTLTSEFLDDIEEHRVAERLKRMQAALLILHAPQDEIVDIDQARRIYAAASQPKSFVSLDGADHLLTRKADSEYVGELIAAWSTRYLPAAGAPDGGREADAPPEGVVRVVGSGAGFAQEVLAGRHRLTADEPPSVGGEDTGPTPYDLLLAALGTCTSMTLGMYARRKRWPLERVAVDLRHARVHTADCEECDEADRRIDRFELTLELEGELDAEQRARLREIAGRCPVHRTLVGDKRIEVALREPPDGPAG